MGSRFLPGDKGDYYLKMIGQEMRAAEKETMPDRMRHWGVPNPHSLLAELHGVVKNLQEQTPLDHGGTVALKNFPAAIAAMRRHQDVLEKRLGSGENFDLARAISDKRETLEALETDLMAYCIDKRIALDTGPERGA